eukprot:gene825-4105_t
MSTQTQESIVALKTEGNKLFTAKKFKEALKKYQEVLKTPNVPADVSLTVRKNMAACHLKLKQYKQALEYASQVLELVPMDTKALYRRSQAHEALGDLASAFRDMATASRADPSNKHMASEAGRLMQIVAGDMQEKQTTAGLSKDMVHKVLSGDTIDTKKQALKNCIVLARDEPGAQQLMKSGFVYTDGHDAPQRLLPLIESSDDEIRLHLLYLLSALAENSVNRAIFITQLIHQKAKTHIGNIFLQGSEKLVNASVRVYAKSLESVTSNEEVVAAAGSTITAILEAIIDVIKNRKLSLHARSAAVNAVMTNSKRFGVANRFIELGGVRALLILAALSPSPLQKQRRNENDSATSPAGLRGVISVTLQHIYESTKKKGLPDQQLVADCSNQVKNPATVKHQVFESILRNCHLSWFFKRFVDDPVANLPAANVLITIMAAVVDIGNQIMEQQDIFGHLMEMAKQSDLELQCAAAEAIASAASDKKRARGVMMEGFPVLKGLYSKDLPAPIRVRALCGLCKMASVGSGAKNLRSMSETSMLNLAKKLRPFLLDSTQDQDIRKWASEGMAYLSLDADVKEYIVGDTDVLNAVHQVCLGEACLQLCFGFYANTDMTIQFSMANMLVNLTNSFDKPEMTEEHEQLKKLGKFAGENIPEPHEKDADDFVALRVDTLIKRNFVTALVQLAKSQSDGTREQIARVLLAMAEKQDHRGVIIAQGGARALLELARQNSEKGKIKAAHALAKIAITSDPTIAFPGQRAAELVQPLVQLSRSPLSLSCDALVLTLFYTVSFVLDLTTQWTNIILRERNGLMMFEAAMAMTNLASINDDLRNKLLHEKAVARLEDMMFDEDPLIRRAATEALCNCFLSEKIYDQFAKRDAPSFERLKLWILFSGVEQDDFDLPTCRAASGGLAVLSSSSDVCQRILEEKQGIQVLKELL